MRLTIWTGFLFSIERKYEAIPLPRARREVFNESQVRTSCRRAGHWQDRAGGMRGKRVERTRSLQGTDRKDEGGEMSKSAERAGIAFHKSEEALREINKIRRELEVKKVQMQFIGLMIISISLFNDLICYSLQVPYRPGINEYQVIGFVIGGLTIIWGGL